MENTEFKTVAKRYAKALLELCESHNANKLFIRNDLINILEALNSSQDLINLMNTPSVPKPDKQRVIGRVFEHKIDKITMNFLMYLIEKDRFNILSSILAEFQAELDKENNLVQIEIVSAIDLDENMRQTIKDRLSGKLNRQINVDWSVNPDIIAGLVFIVGDSIIDTSVKSKLQMIGRNIIK